MYSNLYIEDITDTEYMHTKKLRKDFEIKYSSECHDLHLQSDALLLTDVFENFMANIFKSDRRKLNLLTDIDMLLTIEKGIGGGICHAIHHNAKANDKHERLR